MKKEIIKLSAIALCAVAMMLAYSCADEDVATDFNKQGALAVSFQTETIQPLLDENLKQQANGNKPAYLASQKMTAISSDGYEMVLEESTLPLVRSFHQPAITRATVKTSIDAPFTAFGYSGATKESISKTPNFFYNNEVSAEGILKTPATWTSAQPWADFYAISPLATVENGISNLSGATVEGAPYFDFTVNSDVSKQVDLMTAVAKDINYATPGTAPSVHLQFKHELASIRFAIGDGLLFQKVINKIEIKNAVLTNRYNMGGANPGWATIGSDAQRGNVTLDNVDIETGTALNTTIICKEGDNNVIYMLPQEVAGNNVTATLHFSDGSRVNIKLGGKWLAGTTKTYKLIGKKSQLDSENLHFMVEPFQGANLTDISPTDPQPVGYYVTSYYEKNGEKKPVSWRVFGYDINGDGKFNEEKPEWLDIPLNGKGYAEGGAEIPDLMPDENEAKFAKAPVVYPYVERNKRMQAAPEKGKANDYYDLSTHDFWGNSVSRTTANSYIVSSGGHYKIPLVYGNAITNGRDNIQAYTNNGLSTTTCPILNNFDDHLGKGINGPWITAQYTAKSGEYIPLDSPSDLVKDIQVVGSGKDAYLQFRVDGSKLLNSNAIVAVKDANGTIMWSWHLWFTEAEAMNPVAIKNDKGMVYRFSAEPLGTVISPETQSTSFTAPRTVNVKLVQNMPDKDGKYKEATIAFTQTNESNVIGLNSTTLYQYGRKDPFLGSANEHKVPASIVNESESQSINSNFSRNMGVRIQNPTTFYTDYGHYRNLWSGTVKRDADFNFSKTGDWEPVKTVYDPSPAGFVIPASNAFSGLTNARIKNSDDNNYVSLITDDAKQPVLTFPLIGKLTDQGVRKLLHTDISFWTAMPKDEFYTRYAAFSAHKTHPVNTDTPQLSSYGFSVLPMKITK